MIKAGIIGGAGYTAGELIRLLVNHPNVKIEWVNSNSNAGNKIYEIHEGLIGDTDLSFISDTPLDTIDVLFMCSGHGESTKWLGTNRVPDRVKIIDLSQDFRDETNGFVYGLPEINRHRIMSTSRLANPGCFATAIQLGVIPAIYNDMIVSDIEVTAITGSTGAGVKPAAKTHFSWRTNNISTYKEFNHQHLLEIGRTLTTLSSKSNAPQINFIPVRGDYARGIFASIYFESDTSKDDLLKAYEDFYANSPFTHVVATEIDLKQVVNTNKALIHVEKYGNKVHVVSVIDNLLKGASGQAVENMNLMFGLDESTGLRLKASAF